MGRGSGLGGMQGYILNINSFVLYIPWFLEKKSAILLNLVLTAFKLFFKNPTRPILLAIATVDTFCS